jgi:hypothetical protein
VPPVGTSHSPSRLQEAQTVRETAASPTSIDIKVDTRTASPPVTQEHRQPEPSQEYGAKWEWDPGTRDYVRIGEGMYQRMSGMHLQSKG